METILSAGAGRLQSEEPSPEEDPRMAGALEGYRIVDLTSMITGPLATMILADQGAEVVKVEPPGFGDVMRFLGTGRGGMSALFASCNRNKRSVVLDLRQAAGREILLRMVAGADVVVQNFRPGVVERLGIDEPACRAVRPDVVYVSIDAFGPSGPYAGKPAYDHILQGLSGAAVQQGRTQGSLQPEYVRNAFCDKITAYTAAQGITAALLARERGQGAQHLRLAMIDAAIAFLWPDALSEQMILEDDVMRMPPVAAAYRAGRTTDGWVAVAAITDAHTHGLFRAVGRPELIEDPRFATLPARMVNFEALLKELDAEAAYTSEEAIARMEAEDVPCGPILAPEEVPEHPQIVANQTFAQGVHPKLGRIREPRPPVRFGATPSSLRRPAPATGEHTEQVLRELGLGDAQIAALRDAKVLG
jgi:crotonobetainyl-CoA:carnitine CoA-transferase CaiB-like acyl-CoA transferase